MIHDRPDRREFLAAAAGLLPALALAGNPGRLLRRASSPADASAALPPRVVGLRSLGGAFRFDPAGLLIDPGQTVRWLNMGDFHTATSFHPDNAHLLSDGVPRRVPEGAEAWHSGMLGLTDGTEFEHTFDVEGVHDYFCQPHYGFGMVGRIVVGGSRDGPAVAKGLDELPEAARREMPPVQTITGPAGRTFEWAARINGVLWSRTHGGDASAAAGEVARGMAGDSVLRSVLAESGTAGALDDAVASLLEGTAQIDYDALVGRADDVKRILGAAGTAAR